MIYEPISSGLYLWYRFGTDSVDTTHCHFLWSRLVSDYFTLKLFCTRDTNLILDTTLGHFLRYKCFNIHQLSTNSYLTWLFTSRNMLKLVEFRVPVRLSNWSLTIYLIGRAASFCYCCCCCWKVVAAETGVWQDYFFYHLEGCAGRNSNRNSFDNEIRLLKRISVSERGFSSCGCISL